jgi:tetratricopeptide (TPR) repeat protein
MTHAASRLVVALALVQLSACAHRAPEVPSASAGAPVTPGATAFARARELLAAGDTLRAEQYALLALRQGHPEHEVIVPLVQACLASSRLRAALVYAEPFLRRHPEHVRLRYLVATLHLGLGHAAVAERELARVTARRPDLPEAHYLRGVIARDALGELLEARARFERYLALAPDGDHAAELRAWLAEQPSARAADAVQ